MKLCTFNVNSIRSRLEIVQKLITDYNIDVICIQEIKVENSKFPKILDNLNCIINGQKRLHGVATCSFCPITSYQIGFDEPRFIYSLINDYHIINIYAPLGDKYKDRFTYKMDFYRRLFDFISKFDLKNDKLIICGDFNISHLDIDVWDESVWEGEVTHLKEERAIMDKFLEIGFFDVVREFYKDKRVYTFYDYRGGAVYKNLGLRLDYVLVTKPLIDKVISIEIPVSLRRKRKPTPSDHVPIIIEFKGDLSC